MLDLVTAVRFDGRVQSGRTTPCRLLCVDAHENDVEVVAKLSAGCDRGVAALACEGLAAMLAADLDLPVPEPFLVELQPDFISGLPEVTVADLAKRSNPIAFGSKHLPPGYTSWPQGKAIPRDAIATAAEIFAFDALISNPDRRPENPNCLFLGSNLAIYDHELAFLTEGVLGWRPPWQPGALELLRTPGRHLFSEQLRGRSLDLDRFAGAWIAIADDRLDAYRVALPTGWNSASGTIEQALTHIRQVRDNIELALQEIRRVLA